MATNYLQEGKTIEFTAAADLVSGSVVVVGTVVAIAISTVLSGELAVGLTDGVFELPKAAGAIAQGAKVYLKSDGTITTTASGNTAAGTCWVVAADSDTTIAVKLNR